MELVTTKIHKDTLKRLKLLAVLTDSTMIETLDRVIAAELARVQSVPKEPPHARDPRLQD